MNIVTSFYSKRSVLSLFFICAMVFIEITAQNTSHSIYDYKVETIDGEEFSLASLKGKKIMIVNVASACGLTPQYEQLQSIYEMYQSKGFIILAFPSNDFSEQETGSDSEIKSFCTLNFGVSFPIMSKIIIKESPLYKWLTTKELNNKADYEVSWNFQKFLINRDGSLFKPISPKTRPDDPEIVTWINE